MDVLTDVLNTLELKGWISARRELTPPWHYGFAASHDMIFHLLGDVCGYLSFKEDPTPMLIEGGLSQSLQARSRRDPGQVSKARGISPHDVMDRVKSGSGF